jgi:hypothetical protein
LSPVENQIPTGHATQADAVQFDDEVEIVSRLVDALTQISHPAPIESCFGSLERPSGVGPPGLLLQDRDLS